MSFQRRTLKCNVCSTFRAGDRGRKRLSELSKVTQKVSALIRMVAQAPKLLKQDDYYVLSYCLFYGVTDTFHGNIYISGAKEISFPKKNNYSASPSSFTVMYALFCFSIIGKPA